MQVELLSHLKTRHLFLSLSTLFHIFTPFKSLLIASISHSISCPLGVLDFSTVAKTIGLSLIVSSRLSSVAESLIRTRDKAFIWFIDIYLGIYCVRKLYNPEFYYFKTKGDVFLHDHIRGTIRSS